MEAPLRSAARARPVPEGAIEAVVPMAPAAEFPVGPSAANQQPRQPEPAWPAAPSLLPEIAPGFDPARAEPWRPSDAVPAPYRDERRTIEQGNTRDAEPTEVHVHIGRIEVTAVHEPPARRSKREVRGPTQTLEEYLAGRTGRRAT